MGKRIVINTGPIITLSKINALEVVRDLPHCFVTPSEVLEELDAGVRRGYDHRLPPWIEVQTLKEPLRRLDQVTLGKGEAAVIQLALERSVERVCIDEIKGRRAAVTAGLHVVGVLGLLGRAKREGLIPELKPYILKALTSGIRYHDALVREVLKSVDES